MTIKLKKNESFYIREGWLEKAINCIHDNEGKNIFYKNDGVMYLGIGNNMVKSMKYWLKAANLIEGPDNHLTDFGNYLCTNDPYLDSKFSLFLIHFFLARNKEENPVAYTIFNFGKENMTKAGMRELLMDRFKEEDSNVKEKYVEADLNVFLNSYVRDAVIDNPEDNYSCPLSSLHLMKKVKNVYYKTAPSYQSLPYLVVYYALTELIKEDSFDIDESMNMVNSPVKLFSLDLYSYMQYLDEMRKDGLITITKTAGLNTAYFDKRLGLYEIFEEYFK